MTDITTVADVAALTTTNGPVTFTVTETTTVTKRVTLPAEKVRALVESDGWADAEKLTGDLDIGDLRDAITDAFLDLPTTEREEHTELIVDAITY